MQVQQAVASGGRTGYGGGVPMPGCELQDLLLPALRGRLKPFEPVVMHLPLTSPLVEKMVTDVRSLSPFLTHLASKLCSVCSG